MRDNVARQNGSALFGRIARQYVLDVEAASALIFYEINSDSGLLVVLLGIVGGGRRARACRVARLI